MVEHTTNGTEVLIPRVIGDLRYISTIDKGGYGVVYEGLNERDGLTYACKAVDRRSGVNTVAISALEHEVRASEFVSHEYIGRVYKVLYHEVSVVLVMELYKNRDLLGMILKAGIICEKDAQRIYWQIASAVSYLHGRGMAHGDIKPENIMFDDSFNVKLIDFGSVHLDMTRALAYIRGTVPYSPPEMFTRWGYSDSRPGDIWAMGVILFVMLTGSLPWPIPEGSICYRNIDVSNFTFPPGFPATLLDMTTKCLSPDPNKRPLVAEIMHNEWVRIGEDMSPHKAFLPRRPASVRPASRPIIPASSSEPCGSGSMHRKVNRRPVHLSSARHVPQRSHVRQVHPLKARPGHCVPLPHQRAPPC